MTRFALIALLALAGVAHAGEPPIRVPGPPVVVPVPSPMPGLDTPIKLAADRVFVFDSDVPVFVFTLPDGVVNVMEEAGPLTIKELFHDTKGTKPERRTFAGKFVVTLEPATTGLVSLLIVPQAVASKGDVIRRLLDVTAEEAPDDGKKPKPKPIPVPTAFQAKVKAAFVADGAAKADAGKLAALYRAASTTTVNDAGLTTAAALLAEMQAAVKSLGIKAGSMNGTARVIADELDLTLSKLTTLDDAARAKVKAAFVVVAVALEAIANG